ncbi:MAG: glutamate--tRNA ligase [Gammaproteobacteria bacterium RIFCSPHIGHO2_12_FULL_35_23]|nr:MAG: glutamate--tRNA ligase [Gammaproteobacteria bacterium RIFCSPHIGHO2_12_FULL_35_23]
MTVRSRFAPSPTGYLHIGGARTALFSWLYARRYGGKFILRIEDTDLERSTPEAVQAILEGMNWLGLNYDEGPFYQTNRFARYQEVAEELVRAGKAYRCYCSKERLEKLREEQLANKQKPKYDGRCRELTEIQTGPSVIRFKNPTQGEVAFEDLVCGRIVVNNAELDDLILVRSDDSPTYNFCVVVDDIDMKITHVIRGTDHINNTPRQINLFNALVAKTPHYIHVPMILGEDGKKLSKRHGSVSVMQYRDEGFLPQAVLNYLVRLGWSHGDQEIFGLAEMIELFDAKNISKSAATFNLSKLLWINQHYLKTLPIEELLKQLSYHIHQQKLDISRGPDFAKVVNVLKDRVKTLSELVSSSRCFYENIVLGGEAAQKNLKPGAIEALTRIKTGFERITDWNEESLHNVLTATAEILDLKMGKVAQPVRIAVTGSLASPPLGITLELIGKERVLQRLEQALLYCQAAAQEV